MNEWVEIRMIEEEEEEEHVRFHTWTGLLLVRSRKREASPILSGCLALATLRI